MPQTWNGNKDITCYGAYFDVGCFAVGRLFLVSAVTGPGSYQCYGGVDGEYVWAQFFGPLVLLDLPFTFVADTVSLPFCR